MIDDLPTNRTTEADQASENIAYGHAVLDAAYRYQAGQEHGHERSEEELFLVPSTSEEGEAEASLFCSFCDGAIAGGALLIGVQTPEAHQEYVEIYEGWFCGRCAAQKLLSHNYRLVEATRLGRIIAEEAEFLAEVIDAHA